jgi:hypothetical protein
VTSEPTWASRSVAGTAESPWGAARSRRTEDLYAAGRDVRSPWGDDDLDLGDRPDDVAFRGEVKEQLRLARLRLYSYCMTLSACVLALMAFMYLLTGTADGDAGFTGIGIMFVGLMVVMLWAAMRVTKAGES